MSLAPTGHAGAGRETDPERRPIILVVAEDFRPLMEPLQWLHEAGYDVRACLGPLGADRVCGLFEGGCPELAACDLLITNEAPHPPGPSPFPRREVLREARLRREELPILLVSEEPDGFGDAARSLRASAVIPPRKAELLHAVEDLVGPPHTWGVGPR